MAELKQQVRVAEAVKPKRAQPSMTRKVARHVLQMDDSELPAAAVIFWINGICCVPELTGNADIKLNTRV